MPSELAKADINELPQPIKQRSKKNSVIFALALLLLALLAGGGIYTTYTLQQRIATLTDKLAKANTKTVPNSSTQVASPQIHFIEAFGYPFIPSGNSSSQGLPAPKIDIKLGLSNDYQGVRYPSGGNDRGDAESALTDKNNDEIARWEIGEPTYGQSDPSQLAVIAIDQSWLATTNNIDDIVLRGYSADGISPTTPANKAAYVANVKSDAEKCSQDSKLGFITNDHFFNICYHLSTGPDSYDPILNLIGYAEAQTHPLIFTGSIKLEQGKTYDEATTRSLISNILSKNQYPQSTLDAAQQVVDALKQTTTTVTAASQ